ncbi:MAG: hypothetical protein ABI318_04410 [Chthoniobacteraceae bacterium]
MNLRRLSSLATTLLCALAFLFPAGHASAQDGAVIGTLTFARGCTVLVNGAEVVSGTKIHAGDVVKTSPSCKAQIKFTNGGTLAINTGTQVRIYIDGKVFVAAVAYGSVTPADQGRVRVVVASNGDDGVEPLPYLAAFGFGNFPAGGGSSSSGNVTSVVLPNGHIAFFSSGSFIGFN